MTTELPKPENCILWKHPDLMKSDSFLSFFKLEKKLTDTSHFWENIYKCKECGQLYFEQSTEHVDWAGGNDTISGTFVPVPDEEVILTKMYHKLPIELLQCAPRIQWNSGKDPHWVKTAL